MHNSETPLQKESKLMRPDVNLKSGNVDKKGSNTAKNTCVFTVDNAFFVKTWDSKMEKLCHKSAQAVIGNKIDKIFPILYEQVALVLADGKKRQIKNFKNNCFLGTDFAADIQLNPVKNKNRAVKEVAVVFNNISGGCPLNKMLNDSERMIAIGKIASTLAHGIRNPLNAIKGAVVYLTEKYGQEPTLLEFSTIINDEISRLDNFISNFLSAAKGETKFITTDLNDILKAILVMIKPRTELLNIKTSFNFSVLPPIMADPLQTEQAFFNIINNAVEAMPDGGVIDIRTSLTREEGTSYVHVEISDSGTGIPEKDLHKLGELSTNSEGNDKGFGIFLSREVIKSHGGKLFWESTRGNGTTFKILLPVK
jgi:two-component system nitrogen regulation sensor histidine kinase GlnL